MGTRGNARLATKNTRASQTQYVSVRQKLDDYGYHGYLANESVGLVGRLLEDLVRANEQAAAAQCSNNRLAEEVALMKKNGHRNENNKEADCDKKCRFLEQALLEERRSSALKLEDLRTEKSSLAEKSRDLNFIIDQKDATINRLKRESDAKSQMILRLENGKNSNIRLSSTEPDRPCVERDSDLPPGNAAKIQSLFKRILTAADNPSIVDWVKAAETRIANLELDVANSARALEASRTTCEQYRQQVLLLEKKLLDCAGEDGSRWRSRCERAESECRKLQVQLEDAIRKQHEAMSRAIMLAGNRQQKQQQQQQQQQHQDRQGSGSLKNASGSIQLMEKKTVALESERNLLKQMLNAAQKERDNLVKEIQRLHSQEVALMSEIRSLVSDHGGSGADVRSVKSVRFESTDSASGGSGGGGGSSGGQVSDGAGRSRENWLRRLTEQRQLYYDNVQQLLQSMRNRQDLERQQLQERHSQYYAQQHNHQERPQSQQSRSQSHQERPHAIVTTAVIENETDGAGSCPASARPAVIVRDFGVQTDAAAPTAAATDSCCGDPPMIPRQFQSWSQALLDEKRTLKDLCDALQSRSDRLAEQVQQAEAKLSSLKDQLRQDQLSNCRLESELESVNVALAAAQRDASQERAKAQQLRLEMNDVDTNVVVLTKKLSDRTAERDSARNRSSELESQSAQLEQQLATVQAQLRALQVHRSQADMEQRNLLDEADAYRARIMQLEKQVALKQDTAGALQANVLALEAKLRVMDQDCGDRAGQLETMRRQNQRVAAELEQTCAENSGVKRENERLVSVMATLHAELDRERQAADDLRREVQSYVNRVRQVETILAGKDEERETLLKQLQLLANESCSFDAERDKLEATVLCHQQHEQGLQNELSQVRRRLAELEQLYSQQKSVAGDAQLQADELLRRLAQLERELRDAREDKMRLEQQLCSSNDMHQRLEKQLERLRMEMAQSDTQTHMAGLETTRLHDDINVLEQRLAQERDSARSFESTVAVLRQERAEQETQLRNKAQDLARLQQRELSLQEELANTKSESFSNEAKLTQVSRELNKLRQELLQEKFERERWRQEFKRMTGVNQTPSPAPTASVPAVNVASAPVSTGSQTAPSSANGSPTKRVSVAARLNGAARLNT